MLSQTSRCVLGLLSYLARHGHERFPARQIAVDTGTPADCVAKILGALRKGGVVEGEKGWGGGRALRARVSEVSAGEVMALLEDNLGPVACPFMRPVCGCHLAGDGEERVPIRPPDGRAGSPARVGAAGAARPAAVDQVACPFGASCLVTRPCPPHRQAAKGREGFWGLAETRIGDLAGGAAG